MALPDIWAALFDQVLLQPPYGFDLMRRDEVSRTVNGQPIVSELGWPLWKITGTTIEMSLSRQVRLQAIFNRLYEVGGLFYAYDVRRPYPEQYPGGFTNGFNGVGQVHTVVSNKSLRLKSTFAGFKLSVGDYLAYTHGGGKRALHQVMEDVVADGAGITPTFEVRPFLRPGAAVDLGVDLVKATGLFRMEPGSLQSSLNSGLSGMHSFSALQVVGANA